MTMFCNTVAYEQLMADQWAMRQGQRDESAMDHKLTLAAAEMSASDLTREAMQAARIRAARQLNTKD